MDTDIIPPRVDAITKHITIRRNFEGIPIFMFPTEYGDVSFAHALAQSIPHPCPIYALPWDPSILLQARTLEGLGEKYLEAILKIQQEGPYRLVGFHAGGMLVAVVAQLLAGLNKEVDLLSLISADCLPARKWSIEGSGDIFADGPHILHRPSACSGNLKEDGAKKSSIEPIETINYCQNSYFPEFSFEAENNSEYNECCRWYASLVSEFQPFDSGSEILLFHCDSGVSALEWCKENERANTCPPHLCSPKLEYRGWLEGVPSDRIKLFEVPVSSVHTFPSSDNYGFIGLKISDYVSSRKTDRSIYAAEDTLIPMQVGSGSSESVLCFPGAGATVAALMDFAGSLGDDYNVLGVQTRCTANLGPPHVSIEAAAQFYLDAFASRIDFTTVHIVGHSHGGVVGFELARQLERLGLRPRSLTLIDSAPPSNDGTRVEIYTSQLFREFVRSIEIAKGCTLEPNLDLVEFSNREQFLRLVHASLVENRLISARSSPEILRGSFLDFAAARRSSYRPSSKYRGEMRYVRAKDRISLEPGDTDDAEAYRLWANFAGAVEFSIISGNHFTILQGRNAIELARWWRK